MNLNVIFYLKVRRIYEQKIVLQIICHCTRKSKRTTIKSTRLCRVKGNLETIFMPELYKYTRTSHDLYGIQGNPVAHLTLNNLQILVSHNCIIKFFLFSQLSRFLSFLFPSRRIINRQKKINICLSERAQVRERAR